VTVWVGGRYKGTGRGAYWGWCFFSGALNGSLEEKKN